MNWQQPIPSNTKLRTNTLSQGASHPRLIGRGFTQHGAAGGHSQSLSAPKLRPFQACVPPSPTVVSCKLGVHVTCEGETSPFGKEKNEMKQLLCKKLNLCEQIKKQQSKQQSFAHLKNQLLSFHLTQMNLSYLKLTLFFLFLFYIEVSPKGKDLPLQNRKSVTPLCMLEKYLLTFWPNTQV